jgi:hypothetical protein
MHLLCRGHPTLHHFRRRDCTHHYWEYVRRNPEDTLRRLTPIADRGLVSNDISPQITKAWNKREACAAPFTESLDAGAQEYLIKPVEPHDLRRTVARLIYGEVRAC